MFLNTKVNEENGFGNPTFIFVFCVNLLNAYTKIWLSKQQQDKTISKASAGLGIVLQEIVERLSHQESSSAVLHTIVKMQK